MAIFNFSRVYSNEVWPMDVFSKLIQDNQEMDDQYRNHRPGEYNQPYWSTVAQNPDYNRDNRTGTGSIPGNGNDA